MSGDCLYFQSIIKELNPSETNSGDCCTWSMVECDNQGYIEKLDFSNYNGITLHGPFPQSVAFFTHLKEFSIRGQQGITDIYSLGTDSLEKIDLSNSGMSSPNFPAWLYDAPNLKEIDISGTQMSGFPQREFKSQISGCNFSGTPICDSYENSPYNNYIPDVCKTSCKNGATYINGSSGSSGKKTNSGGTKIWPFILIGVGALLVIGLLAFLFLKRGKKDKNELDYEEDSPKPILPVAKNKKNNIKRDDSVEITVNEPVAPQANVPANIPPVATPPVAAPPAAVVNNKRVEEMRNNVPQNNYPMAGKKQIYNENRVSGASVDHEQSIQPHPSIYNTMTTDNDSDEEVSDIINEPIIAALDLKNDVNQNQTPALLRRSSSRKNNVKAKNKNNVPVENTLQEESVAQEEDLYIANWDYAPTLSDELALTAGDVIEIKKKFDDGWCTGYNRRTDQTGIVPLCYLKEYED